MLGYQRPFIKGFAAIAKPLTDLLKKGREFLWTPECTKSLDDLLTIVELDPVLYWLDYEWPFEIEVDTSQYAIGAILYQQDDQKKRRVVAMISHTLTPTE